MIKSFAKINLCLSVNSKRKDGYHNLTTIMKKINLYDEMYFDFSASKTEIVSDKFICKQEDNLVYKAINLFKKRTNLEFNTKVSIKKNIPMGSGLAGSSSNAANTLLILNEYFDNRVHNKILHEIATVLGADVSFFLYKGMKLAKNKGEKLKEIKNIDFNNILIVTPYIEVSTKEIFQKLSVENHSNLKDSFLIDKFYKKHYNYLVNDLESVTFKMYPQIKEIKDILIKEGAELSLMSGSGSSIFAIFKEEENMKRLMKYFRQSSRVFSVGGKVE